MQRSDACRVAGYQTWHKLGRYVKKGEKIRAYDPQTDHYDLHPVYFYRPERELGDSSCKQLPIKKLEESVVP